MARRRGATRPTRLGPPTDASKVELRLKLRLRVTRAAHRKDFHVTEWHPANIFRTNPERRSKFPRLAPRKTPTRGPFGLPHRPRRGVAGHFGNTNARGTAESSEEKSNRFFFVRFEARPARRVDAYGDARPRRCARGRLPRLTGGRRPGRGVPARRTRRVASPRWWAPPRIRTPRDAPPPRARRPRNRASPSAPLRRRPRPRVRRTHPAGPARPRRASPRAGPRSRCGASRRRARARAWRPPSRRAGPWNEPRVRSVRPARAFLTIKISLRPRAARGRLPLRRSRS